MFQDEKGPCTAWKTCSSLAPHIVYPQHPAPYDFSVCLITVSMLRATCSMFDELSPLHIDLLSVKRGTKIRKTTDAMDTRLVSWMYT